MLVNVAIADGLALTPDSAITLDSDYQPTSAEPPRGLAHSFPPSPVRKTVADLFLPSPARRTVTEKQKGH